MKDFRSTFQLLTIAASIVSAAGPSQAQMLSDNGTSRDLGQSTFFNTSGSSPGSTAYFVGAKSLTYTPAVGASSTFWAYCIDPKTNAGFPSSGYSSSSLASFLDGTANSGYAQQVANVGTGYAGMNIDVSALGQETVRNNLINLFSHAYNDAIGGVTPTTLNVATSAKSAAFGMAVWEIMTQDESDSSGLSSIAGNMRSAGSNLSNPDSVETWTNAYLAALNTNSWSNVNGVNLSVATTFTYTVWSDTAPGLQNFLQVTPGGSNNVVPLPGTLALVGLALAGAMRISRRRAVAT